MNWVLSVKMLLLYINSGCIGMIKPQSTQRTQRKRTERWIIPMLTDLILIHQLQLPDLGDRQKAEIIAEFLPLCNPSQRSLPRGFSDTNCWGNGKIVGWWWRGLRGCGRSHIRKKPSRQLTESLKILKNKQEFSPYYKLVNRDFCTVV